MKFTSDNFRRAVILIDSLDRDSADTLLDQLNDAQAGRIRQAVVDLDDVSHAERERVMSDFLAEHAPRPHSVTQPPVEDDGGIEIDASLAARISENHDDSATYSTAAPGAQSPFRFLHQADAAVIAKFLDRENPQAVAVVLAHLPPEQSAEVLARLAPRQQTDVVRRIVNLSETPPEVLRDVEHELGSKLSEQLTQVHRREEGLEAVRRILGAADPSLRKDLLAHVATAENSMSAQLPPRSRENDRRGSEGDHLREGDPVREGEAPAEPKLRPRTFGSPPAPARRHDWLPADARPTATLSRSITAETPSDAPPSNKTPRTPPASTNDGNSAAGPATQNVPPAHKKPTPETAAPRIVPQNAALPMAERDERPAARFEDVPLLNDAVLASVFSDVDTDVALLALTAADPKFVQRVLKQLPRRDAKYLAKRLARPVPMRLSEIERAQREVAERAEQLRSDGKTEWNKPTERLAAVA